MRAIVERLCSDACRGRAPGTPGGEAARRIILEEMKARGLEPAGPGGAYEQPVPGCGGANLIARVPGPKSERAILLAAHHDHLGQHGHEIYWGADDNAAAVAILLEAASALAAGPARGREILIVTFDGEEPPFYLGDAMGSVYFTAHPTHALERIDTMVCMDLMGHAVGGPGLPDEVRRSVFVLGAEHGAGNAELVDAVAARTRELAVRRLGADVIPPLSDYWAFMNRGVPFLFLTSGRWAHYHTPEDTPEKLDYEKMAASARFLADLAAALADRPEAPVRWLPNGRDDRATLASLLAIARHLPGARRGVAVLEPLLARVERGQGLTGAEHARLPMLVAQLEELLAG